MLRLLETNDQRAYSGKQISILNVARYGCKATCAKILFKMKLNLKNENKYSIYSSLHYFFLIVYLKQLVLFVQFGKEIIYD